VTLKYSIKGALILLQEAGLARFSEPFKLSYTQRENIKKNHMGSLIERQSPRWPSPEFGSTRMYHGLTRGFVLNEIFRRLDAQGRTIGEYFDQEIAKPLKLTISMGVKKHNVQTLSVPTKNEVLIGSVTPTFLGGSIEVCTIQIK